MRRWDDFLQQVPGLPVERGKANLALGDQGACRQLSPRNAVNSPLARSAACGRPCSSQVQRQEAGNDAAASKVLKRDLLPTVMSLI